MEMMKKTTLLILGILLLSSLAYAGTEKVLVVEFSIDKSDKVELLDVRLGEGVTSAGDGDYSLVLLSKTGKELSEVKFSAEFVAWADPIDPEKAFPFPPGGDESIGKYGSVKLDEMQFLLKAPYSEEATEFQIKKGTKILLEGKIELCNEDGKCQPERGENYISCEDDCASGSNDEYCDDVFDGKCDPDCKAMGRSERDTDCTCGNGVCDPREDGFYCEQDCGKPSNPFMKWIIGAAAVVLLIIVLVIFLLVKLSNALFGKKKKHEKKEEKGKHKKEEKE